MSNYKARQIHLIRRPVGMPTHDDFALVEVALQPPDDGEVLVQNGLQQLRHSIFFTPQTRQQLPGDFKLILGHRGFSSF